ncbi:MAG: M48 family metallopeptidase [Chromatiales bacterium]|nr:M48 family metallopeptidase [Chromatiales bacterium]
MTHRHPAILFLTLTLSVLAFWSAPQVMSSEEPLLLPEIGDASGALLTPAEEKRLGEAFMRQVRRTQKVVSDPELTAYLQALGNRLAVNADPSTQPFTFFLVDAPSVNAYAGPGGFIGVHTGLVEAAKNESELAGVLAHEMGHVTQRHLYRAYDNARKMSLPLAAIALAGILIGATAGLGGAGIAAVAGAQAGAVQSQLNFSRNNEQEADRVGLRTLASSGFDPMAMPDFFERLDQESRYYENKAPEFLRTHPVTTSRIADTRGRAAQYPTAKTKDSLSFLEARAKLRVLTATTAHTALEGAKARLAKAPDDIVAQYEYALALRRADKGEQAAEQFRKLLNSDSDRLAYLLPLATSLLQAGKQTEAFDLLESTSKVFPDNWTVVYHYAESLLQYGHPAKAQTLLESYQRAHGPSSEFYRMLARAYSDSGQSARGHLTVGEFYYTQGQTEPAVRQLEIAKREAGDDFYLASQIEARLKEFQTVLAEEEKDKQGKGGSG